MAPRVATARPSRSAESAQRATCSRVRRRARGSGPRVPARGDERMSTVEAQRGVALVMAIIVVAIGTMIAVNLMWRETLDMRRTEAALAADQGLMYVQCAEAWAAAILRQDVVDSPDSDNLGGVWALEFAPLPAGEDGGI